MIWTIDHIEKLYQQGKIRSYRIIGKSSNKLSETPDNSRNNDSESLVKLPKKRKSKYAAIKTEIDGIVFDSSKEARRYTELKILRKAGHIGLLKLQVEYELNAGGTHSLKYVADFVYMDSKTGKTIVEDVKGFRTREYKKKKRLMKKVHQIDIREI